MNVLPSPVQRRYKWLPVIDPDLCNGCNLCVEACGPGSLELVGQIAHLARPDTCGSEEHCIPVCKAEAIRMAWVACDGQPERGRWQDDSSGGTASN